MDRRRLTRVALIGAAALSASACAQQQPKLAAVSRSNTFAFTSADRECMARAMYFESNKSSSDGMLAVGSIVANRVQSGRYGTTVCEVVGAKRQFAPGVLTRTMSGPSADLARATADQVLAGKRHVGVKSAMHFHTAGMRFPYPNMHYVLVAGGNAFYEKRDSSGGGRASNARSLALALAHAKVDSQPIVVAAATPLEAPIPAAVSTGSVPMTAKAPAAAPVAIVTQVAAAKPAPAAQPIVVASAAPTSRPAFAGPVAYAPAERPVVSFPKIRPAPKREISVENTEPALASVAPASKRSPAPGVDAAQSAARPVASVDPVASADPRAASHVASAFAAFD